MCGNQESFLDCENYAQGYCIQVNGKVGILEECEIGKYPEESRNKYIQNCPNKRVMKIIENLEKKTAE